MIAAGLDALKGKDRESERERERERAVTTPSKERGVLANFPLSHSMSASDSAEKKCFGLLRILSMDLKGELVGFETPGKLGGVGGGGKRGQGEVVDSARRSVQSNGEGPVHGHRHTQSQGCTPPLPATLDILSPALVSASSTGAGIAHVPPLVICGVGGSDVAAAPAAVTAPSGGNKGIVGSLLRQGSGRGLTTLSAVSSLLRHGGKEGAKREEEGRVTGGSSLNEWRSKGGISEDEGSLHRRDDARKLLMALENASGIAQAGDIIPKEAVEATAIGSQGAEISAIGSPAAIYPQHAATAAGAARAAAAAAAAATATAVPAATEVEAAESERTSSGAPATALLGRPTSGNAGQEGSWVAGAQGRDQATWRDESAERPGVRADVRMGGTPDVQFPLPELPSFPNSTSISLRGGLLNVGGNHHHQHHHHQQELGSGQGASSSTFPTSTFPSSTSISFRSGTRGAPPHQVEGQSVGVNTMDKLWADAIGDAQLQEQAARIVTGDEEEMVDGEDDEEEEADNKLHTRELTFAPMNRGNSTSESYSSSSMGMGHPFSVSGQTDGSVDMAMGSSFGQAYSPGQHQFSQFSHGQLSRAGTDTRADQHHYVTMLRQSSNSETTFQSAWANAMAGGGMMGGRGGEGGMGGAGPGMGSISGEHVGYRPSSSGGRLPDDVPKVSRSLTAGTFGRSNSGFHVQAPSADFHRLNQVMW